MPLCPICTNERVKEINRELLNCRPLAVVGKKFDMPGWQLKVHRRKHLPFRSPRLAPAVTVAEQLADLKLELRRLQILAECGENVSGALAVVRQRQSLLELEARMDGQLDATHKKLIQRSRAPEGNFEVRFINGRAVTVPAGEQP